jgi:UDP-GlcNAc3NAcA epimerase
MLTLISSSIKVLTDSGGLQKEAIWLGKPCVTLRDETEWTETLAGGWNQVTGADSDAILSAVKANPEGEAPQFGEAPEGSASSEIVQLLSG